MKINKLILKVSIISLMVFSPMIVTDESHAYWAGAINDSANSAIGTVTTGTWEQIFQWDPNKTYSAGDLVTNNGNTYEAKRDNPTREPGVGGGWQRDWTQV